MQIIYQDDHLVAVNKPAGWLVHRSWLDRKEKVVVMQTVRDMIGRHVYTVHRLDRPTSGVLLLGLSSEIARALAQQFEQHQIHKVYHAVVRGYLQGEALLDYPLTPELDKIADRFRSPIVPRSQRRPTTGGWQRRRCRWPLAVIRRRALAWLS